MTVDWRDRSDDAAVGPTDQLGVRRRARTGWLDRHPVGPFAGPEPSGTSPDRASSTRSTSATARASSRRRRPVASPGSSTTPPATSRAVHARVCAPRPMPGCWRVTCDSQSVARRRPPTPKCRPVRRCPSSVVVDQTAPTVAVVNCYERMAASYVAYFCAVPVTLPTKIWSGRSLVNGLALAASVADARRGAQTGLPLHTRSAAIAVVPTGIKQCRASARLRQPSIAD